MGSDKNLLRMSSENIQDNIGILIRFYHVTVLILELLKKQDFHTKQHPE